MTFCYMLLLLYNRFTVCIFNIGIYRCNLFYVPTFTFVVPSELYIMNDIMLNIELLYVFIQKITYYIVINA